MTGGIEQSMIEIQDIPAEKLQDIEVLLTDIDDTLSTRGKITAEAFQALWDLQHAGLRVVIVTGRPAGWCDHIARFWPVDAVVGENGGFYFFHDGEKLVRRFLHSREERADFRERLRSLRNRILKEVPGCGIASDQPYREYDLAIDFCEDVKALPREAVLRIKAIFEEEGAHAKISSIHVNGWFGDFDKLSTSKKCLSEHLGYDAVQDRSCFAFCGDSPNDEPMFAFFEHSFGMANLKPYLDIIKSYPSYITLHECGAGFQEVVERILRTKRKET
ncbi:MAG: HAD-IIB family hydrolase [Planctomycetota bacterium]|jgi:HAD superfamily hydrolase (TIGR01484 family)